jgi:hypothetical protein
MFDKDEDQIEHPDITKDQVDRKEEKLQKEQKKNLSAPFGRHLKFQISHRTSFFRKAR